MDQIKKEEKLVSMETGSGHPSWLVVVGYSGVPGELEEGALGGDLTLM